MDPPILFDPKSHAHLVPSIVAVHAACITQAPYTIATFLPPLDSSKMTTWWNDRVSEVIAGTRFIIIQLGSNPETGKEEVAGVVALDMPISETGPFRSIVEKLLVLPTYRNKGIAKRMMGLIEEVAVKAGRPLIMLDTITGSPAELVYPRLGYINIGIIPDYGISPEDNKTLAGATFFYKDLRKSGKN